MKLLLPVICLLAPALHAAWVFEDIPTSIQTSFGLPSLPGKEIASAYRPVYDSGGAKLSENIAIAYRSKYLYLALRQGTGWNGIRFDDTGRYPSIALDSNGRPHMSYFRSSDSKLYYAFTVAPGTGNCGPSGTWECVAVPTTIFGAPIGHSAITVYNNKIELLVETASGNSTYPSNISLLSRTIGAPDWDPGAIQISLSRGLADLDLKYDSTGTPQILINSEYLDWYRRTSSGLTAIGPLMGTGAFAITSAQAPRLCYRDFTANELIYASSNGTAYWTQTVIDYNIGVQGSCSIAIPEDTGTHPIGYYNPRVAYFDDADSTVKYATPSILQGQPWSIQTVAAATGTRTLDLYLDRQASPSLIYFDSSLLKIRLAKLQ